jgi:hypothetical protein
MVSQASRRSQLLIEPYKQLRFGAMFLCINLVFCTLIISIFGYFLWDMYGAISQYFKLDEKQSMITAAKFSVPFTFGLGLMLLFIFITLFASARYTHQIYGPLVSIRRFLDELIAGKTPSPIKLRKTDQLQDLAHRLNAIADRVAFMQNTESRQTILVFLEAFLAGKTTEPLDLSADDPLKDIAEKLNQIAKVKGKVNF